MSDEDLLSEDELRLGISILDYARLGVTIVGFIAIAFQIWAGYTGWYAFIAIPAFAAVWFGFRVLKRMIQNIKTGVVEELNERFPQDHEGYSAFQDASDSDAQIDVSRSLETQVVPEPVEKIETAETTTARPASAALNGVVLMIFVALLWYGIGLGAAFLVNLF